MHYSRLTCAACLLCAAPPVPSSRQGDHLLLLPGQQSSHAVNMRFDKSTISPCIYATYFYIFYSTFVRVDLTPTASFKTGQVRHCRWTLELGAHSHCPLHSELSHSRGAFALPQDDHRRQLLKEQCSPTMQGTG